MPQRIHIVPTRPMARVLAGHHPDTRATDGAAALILLREGYLPDDIAAGLTDALTYAAEIDALVSPKRVARAALAIVRDLAACAAVITVVALLGLPGLPA